jgi:hypothetical protein
MKQNATITMPKFMLDSIQLNLSLNYQLLPDRGSSRIFCSIVTRQRIYIRTIAGGMSRTSWCND